MTFNLRNFIAVTATIIVAILILTASFGGGSPRAGVAFLTGASDKGSKMVENAVNHADSADHKMRVAERAAETAQRNLQTAKRNFTDSLCIQRDTITSRDSTIAKQKREIAKLQRELKIARAGGNCYQLPGGAHFDVFEPVTYFYKNAAGEHVEFSAGSQITTPGILGMKPLKQ